jgi:phosphomethylpyrimidine synthase
MESARDKATDPRLRSIAEIEGVPLENLVAGIADGTIVAPWAHGNNLKQPFAVGDGLRVKVNANIGTSPKGSGLEEELIKLRVALDAGAHAVMDLSTGGDIRSIRRRIRAECPVPLGSVPMYDAGRMALDDGRSFNRMTGDDMLEAVRQHVEDGVDFITVHCGITMRSVELIKENPRVGGIVSRGGSLIARWIAANGLENPLYDRFEEVIDICHAGDCALSLGDSLRPGALADAGDRAQIDELYTLGELASRARESGVQVMIEGPGHVPLDQVAAQMELEKVACDGAPFYVLGPLVTDVAPGYDHICCAIGGALAAVSGANFLCYVTPAEHLRLPGPGDVREGVIAARIAAHAADIANGIPDARDWDDEMSRARRARDWEKMTELAINPEKVRDALRDFPPGDDNECTMCGEFCALLDDERAEHLL